MSGTTTLVGAEGQNSVQKEMTVNHTITPLYAMIKCSDFVRVMISSMKSSLRSEPARAQSLSQHVKCFSL